MNAITILHKKLVEAGLPVIGVSDNGDGTFRVDFAEGATQQQQDEAAAIVAAFDPVAEVAQQEAIEEGERLDFDGLEDDTINELAWIETTLTEIDAGLAAVGAFTNAGQRAIVTGLLQNQRRTLLQQRRELKAWRYVIRRLK